jgi:hypothetical protein
VVGLLAVLNTCAELISWMVIASPNQPTSSPMRWLFRHVSGTWQHSLRVNVTGVGGYVILAALGYPVSFYGLPATVTSVHLIAFWLFTILYAIWCARAVVQEITVGSAEFAARPLLAYRLFRWLIWPLITALSLLIVTLWKTTDHFASIDSAYPTLVVISIIPLLFRAETGLFDRTLMAADDVHRAELAQARANLAEQSAQVAGPLVGLAESALRRPDSYDSNQAALAVAGVPDLLIALGCDTGLTTATVRDALRSATHWWKGPVTIECAVTPLTIWELDCCLRLTRRVTQAVTENATDTSTSATAGVDGSGDPGHAADTCHADETAASTFAIACSTATPLAEEATGQIVLTYTTPPGMPHEAFLQLEGDLTTFIAELDGDIHTSCPSITITLPMARRSSH